MASSARTDGDTWTITTSVGFTALLVAAARAVETERPDALAQDPYARVFLEAAGDPRAVALADAGDGEGNPMAATRHLGVRTRFFDDFVRDAVAAGTRQIVILAAGLDSRAYRLDLPAGTVVYELDQPEVLAFKEETLDAHRARPAAGLRHVPIDLRDDWPTALRSTGFDGAAPTAWLVEGLLPYLPAAAQALLFERIVELSAPGSRVAVEGQLGPLDLDRFRAITEKYSQEGNPLGDFDVTSLFVADEDRDDPVDFLTAQGWTVERAGNPVELGHSYGVQDTVPADAALMADTIGYFTAALPAR
ncbi:MULTISPECIES: SAM-dependent methyltransferase [Tsukamurella]|uniref:S-adenosyl-L-methionine-dependent methyltransferase n=2 Tax=Tsukamurella TaxID=2060 RepID=A0A5C5S4M0_9ACTN|nr:MULTISPECIES: SAM-dependent methyltransferase [Tsukamurella]NMD55767.1 SAM-dependent methyltransferase [Tsukamurella columbiensis]TWS30456.1 SAM-dependent methyltransferase [Tsukamurella conjunctivitidis]